MTEQEIERLYRRRSAHFVGLATWLTGSRAHAEEVVQDAFINLVARPPQLRDQHALDAYVRRAVVNGGNSYLRRRALERRHAKLDEHPVEDEHADESLRESVRRLPLRQRQCIVLRYYEDLKVEQIAETLGMRPGTVKSHLHRALKSLNIEMTKGMVS